jgi:RNA polymerase sigma-70 factor (ECF subfamily)
MLTLPAVKPKERSRPPSWDADDAELMGRVGQGCGESWLALFQRYRGLAFHTALRIVEDRGEAEETVQQVFLDLFRAQGQFDPRKGSFKMWLLQYAYNRARDRRRKLESSRFYDLISFDNLWKEEGVEEPKLVLGLNSQEIARLKDELFANLNDTERKICELRLIEGLTIRELISETGETRSVVRRYYQAGRAKLRAGLMKKRKEREIKGNVENNGAPIDRS